METVARGHFGGAVPGSPEAQNIKDLRPQEEDHKRNEVDPAKPDLFSNTDRVYRYSNGPKTRGIQYPTRQGGTGGIGAVHQQKYVEQVERIDRKKLASNQWLTFCLFVA